MEGDRYSGVWFYHLFRVSTCHFKWDPELYHAISANTRVEPNGLKKEQQVSHRVVGAVRAPTEALPCRPSMADMDFLPCKFVFTGIRESS